MFCLPAPFSRSGWSRLLLLPELHLVPCGGSPSPALSTLLNLVLIDLLTDFRIGLASFTPLFPTAIYKLLFSHLHFPLSELSVASCFSPWCGSSRSRELFLSMHTMDGLISHSSLSRYYRHWDPFTRELFTGFLLTLVVICYLATGVSLLFVRTGHDFRFARPLAS